MSALSSIVDHLYEMLSSCINPNLNCCPHLVLNLNRVYNFQYRLSSKFVFNPRNSLTTTPKFGYFEHYSLPDFSVSKQFFCKQTVSQTHQQTTPYPPPDLFRQSVCAQTLQSSLKWISRLIQGLLQGLTLLELNCQKVRRLPSAKVALWTAGILH